MRTVNEISDALRDGRISARQLAEDFLSREHATDKQLHSFIAVNSTKLLAEADKADAELRAGNDRGALHGIPIGIKDIIHVSGYPTRCGSPLYPTTPVSTDAVVVQNLRSAGALIAGKTTSHELACGVVSAPASNPWNTNYIPGGSSGGSGAAVAAGLVPIALGSDTGGSIRIPASLCGVVGLKPTYGLVSVQGVEPLSSSLDHLGPLGATVADCAHAMNALTKGATTSDYCETLGQGVGGMRFGILTDAPFSPMQPDVEKAFFDAVDVFRSLGAECVPVSIPELQYVLATEFGIIPLEAFLHHAESLRKHPADIDPSIRTLLIAGAVIPASIHRRASRARVVIARAMNEACNSARLDALLSPTLPAVAAAKTVSEFIYGDISEHISVSYVRTTAPFNLSGQPAISVPCGRDSNGLPIGLQVATRPHRDDLALRIAAAYEQSTPWSDQRIDGLG